MIDVMNSRCKLGLNNKIQLRNHYDTKRSVSVVAILPVSARRNMQGQGEQGECNFKALVAFLFPVSQAQSQRLKMVVSGKQRSAFEFSLLIKDTKPHYQCYT